MSRFSSNGLRLKRNKNKERSIKDLTLTLPPTP